MLQTSLLATMSTVPTGANALPPMEAGLKGRMKWELQLLRVAKVPATIVSLVCLLLWGLDEALFEEVDCAEFFAGAAAISRAVMSAGLTTVCKPYLFGNCMREAFNTV